MEYDIKPWVKYKVHDNGVLAPKGSNPTFHTESAVFNSMYNPIHPLVHGYIMHDQMNRNELVPERRFHISMIDFENSPQPVK